MTARRPREMIYRMMTRDDGSLDYLILSNDRRGQTESSPSRTGAALTGSLISKDMARFSQTGDPRTCRRGDVQEEPQLGTLSAFGMFWKRSLVNWSGRSMLLGRQSNNGPTVNFAQQIGLYLLQDGARTIYVGRAADSLYARLKAHTTDRMAGRWCRFSWFGLRSVSPDGTLLDAPSAWDRTVVIRTIEALLIESLEPPLNRRRGDGLCGLEYLQASDPFVDLIRAPQMHGELT